MVQQAEIEAAAPVVAERVRDLRSEVAERQVVEKSKRRRFSSSHKLKILGGFDRNLHRSGAILRSEGLSSSHLSAWRKQREEGALRALDKKRGPKGKSAEQVQIEKRAREKARLERELYKASAIIDAQKTLAEILGVDLPKITDRDRTQSGVELGYHHAERGAEKDPLLPVRAARYLQPLRGGLDAQPPRIGRARGGPARAEYPRARGRARRNRRTCRPCLGAE